MTKKIVPILEGIPHLHYCEPFGGGASVLLAKQPPGGVETYNDIDSALADFFRVLADPDLFEQFYRRVAVLPASREIYNDYRSSWRDETDRIKRVAMWFYVARMSFGGHFGHSFGTVVTYTSRDMAETASNWLSVLDMLPQIHDRLQRVQIENADWRVVIERYDTPDTLFYCDPPYIHETRSSTRYEHEMTTDDHRELVQSLLSVRGKVALSGYAHPIYEPLESAGWRRIDWETACYAVGRTRATGILGPGVALEKQKRIESLWLSPNACVQMRLAGI